MRLPTEVSTTARGSASRRGHTSPSLCAMGGGNRGKEARKNGAGDWFGGGQDSQLSRQEKKKKKGKERHERLRDQKVD